MGEKSCIGPDNDFKLCPNNGCQNLTEFNSTQNFTLMSFEESNFNISNKKPVKNNKPLALDLELRTINTCGKSLKLEANETIQITSPGYPEDYPLEIECSYLIKTNNESKIRLSFEYINIESTSFYTCPDSVEIRYYALGQPGIRICGNYSRERAKKKLEYTSQNNSVMIVFRSDWINSGKGFFLKLSNLS